LKKSEKLYDIRWEKSAEMMVLRFRKKRGTGKSEKTQHFRPPFATFNAQMARNSQKKLQLCTRNVLVFNKS